MSASMATSESADRQLVDIRDRMSRRGRDRVRPNPADASVVNVVQMFPQAAPGPAGVQTPGRTALNRAVRRRRLRDGRTAAVQQPGPSAPNRAARRRESRPRAVTTRWMMAGAEMGMATAEYAIATLAAVGFAGLLVVILRSGEVRALLMGIIRQALSFGS